MAGFSEMVEMMVEGGVYQYLLPFVLIWVVTYALLNKSKVVDNSSLEAVIATVIAFMATLFFASVPAIGAFFAFFAGKIGILLIVILFALIVNAFVNTEVKVK